MPLTIRSEIDAQEALFRAHSTEFFSIRTEGSEHPEQCIDLLKGHFSRKLGLDPEVNFFAYNSLLEFKEKRNEIELLPDYEEVDRKIRRYQPRAALNAYEKFLKRYGVDAKKGRDSELDTTIDWGEVLEDFAGEHGLSKKVFSDGFLHRSIYFKNNLSLTYDEIKDDLYVFLSFASGKKYGLICKNIDDAEELPYIVETESNWPKKDSSNVSLLNHDGPICVYYRISTKSSACKDEAKNCMEKLYHLISAQKNNSEQKIFFGAPGTGKSYKVNQIAPEDSLVTFRTTFHPDYDYAQFVGSYKPKKDKDDPKRIVYEFVPQVFAKAYAAAWSKFIAADKKSTADNQVYLVIEEINRGNCAQIFGDIFQLLDRKDVRSEYPIDVDSDFADFIRAELADKFNDYKKEICSYCEDAAAESQTAGDEFCKIALPPNFNILATMNTSDQSLFPMDSAFKRRFDWEYVPIDYKQKDAAEFKVSLKKYKEDENPVEFNWLHFLKKVNADIYKVIQSEDKQMGEFFVKPKDGVIDLNMFRSKVLFYLWDSVYKDEVDSKTMFHFKYPDDNGNEVTFQSLFGDDEKSIKIIKQMMDNLDKAYESKDGSEFKDFKILT